jgi:hypothetical protein
MFLFHPQFYSYFNNLTLTLIKTLNDLKVKINFFGQKKNRGWTSQTPAADDNNAFVPVVARVIP